LITLAATWVFPFYWMFTSALKDDSQVYTIPPVLVPNPAHWNNFIDAWTHNNFNRYAFNSIFYY
jgi:multiple sugar transport system permease protein